jgi:hypothetical protein
VELLKKRDIVGLVVALLLVALTGTPWIASYRHEFELILRTVRGTRYEGIDNGMGIYCYRGEIAVGTWDRKYPRDLGDGNIPYYRDRPFVQVNYPWDPLNFPKNSLFRQAGFFLVQIRENVPQINQSQYFVIVPLWFLLLASAGLCWFLARRISRIMRIRRRQLAKLCVQCGYDLRASPARCPECGRMPE